MAKGLIFDIQGYSVHDGPGTRTLIFLSGCPLRCAWCANPEGQKIRHSLMYKPQLCTGCPRRCADACPAHAIIPRSEGEGLVKFDRRLCDTCDSMECLKSCYTRALQRSGRWYTVDEVMAVLNRDRDYWGPEGGVTLSGGNGSLPRRCSSAAVNRSSAPVLRAAGTSCGLCSKKSRSTCSGSSSM